MKEGVIAQHMAPAFVEDPSLLPVDTEAAERGTAAARRFLVHEVNPRLDHRLPAPGVEPQAEIDVAEFDREVFGIEAAAGFLRSMARQAPVTADTS